MLRKPGFGESAPEVEQGQLVGVRSRGRRARNQPAHAVGMACGDDEGDAGTQGVSNQVRPPETRRVHDLQDVGREVVGREGTARV